MNSSDDNINNDSINYEELLSSEYNELANIFNNANTEYNNCIINQNEVSNKMIYLNAANLNSEKEINQISRLNYLKSLINNSYTNNNSDIEYIINSGSLYSLYYNVECNKMLNNNDNSKQLNNTKNINSNFILKVDFNNLKINKIDLFNKNNNSLIVSNSNDKNNNNETTNEINSLYLSFLID